MLSTRTPPARSLSAFTAEADSGERARIDPPLAAYVPLAGFLALLGLSAVLGDARGDLPDPASLLLFALTVGGCASVATPMTAMLLAGSAWLDYDGFVVGRAGSLSWHGRSDLIRLLVLLGTAFAVLTWRWARRWRRPDAPGTLMADVERGGSWRR